MSNGEPRVALVCGPLYPERAFVSRLAESANVVGVLVNNYLGQTLPYLRVPAGQTSEAVAHLASQDIAASAVDAVWRFGWSSQFFCLTPAMTAYEIWDINDPALFSLLEGLRPDVILVFGTGMIRDPRVLSMPVPKYNLHWGLSPYYRGSFTLRWPIVNDEPEKLGVTIHELTARIDGGPLVAQQLMELDGSENAKDVEYAASDAGIRMMQEIVGVMNRGEAVTARDQDFSLGRLYLFHAWSPERDADTEARLEEGFATRARRRTSEVTIKELESAASGASNE